MHRDRENEYMDGLSGGTGTAGVRADDPLAGQSIAVVGSGFGGLSTACYLADAGADVTVLEKNDQLGGRASQFETEGFRFDMARRGT